MSESRAHPFTPLWRRERERELEESRSSTELRKGGEKAKQNRKKKTSNSNAWRIQGPTVARIACDME